MLSPFSPPSLPATLSATVRIHPPSAIAVRHGPRQLPRPAAEQLLGALVQEAGETLILYHAVDAARPRSRPEDEVNTRRIMLTARLAWRDGWPVLAD